MAQESASTARHLDDYFEGLETLRADFVQLVFDDRGREVERSTGWLALARPGRFHWFYRQPYPQRLVADGERLWLYDIELDQVTVKPLSEVLSAAPAALLSGAVDWRTAFRAEAPVIQGDLVWYRLRPKDPEASFTTLWLGFEGKSLRALELQDALQRRTRLGFDKLERNIPVDGELFRFTPPPGVDVIGADTIP
ncbi:MAG: outer membrane lipoprotein chaperone LolA [Candidatus Competibacterales bacterium]